MILVIDIGNSNIKIGVYKEEKLMYSCRLQTMLGRTSDEYGIQMRSFFRHRCAELADVEGVVISSVLPSINHTFERMCDLYIHGLEPMLVSSKLDLGLNIRYDYPELLGSDRICNAVEAYVRYGGPVVVVDFGTATTFTVVDGEGNLLGGPICPGMQISSDALAEKAALLYKVEYVRPERIIARNTRDALRAGAIHGFVGQVDYIIRHIQQELGQSCTIVGTGGMSTMIANETDSIDYLEPTLTLDGLYSIYARNC